MVMLMRVIEHGLNLIPATFMYFYRGHEVIFYLARFSLVLLFIDLSHYSEVHTNIGR